MIEEIRVLIGNFLNINIIDLSYIFLDLWSVVHLLVGATILYMFLKYEIPAPFMFLFVGLIGYEMVEYVFYTILLPNMFIPENVLNVMWDLIIGMSGGAISFFVIKKQDRK